MLIIKFSDHYSGVTTPGLIEAAYGIMTESQLVARMIAGLPYSDQSKDSRKQLDWICSMNNSINSFLERLSAEESEWIKDH